MERQTQFNLWYFVLAALAVMWLHGVWVETRTVEPITYSEFVDYLKDGKIEAAWIMSVTLSTDHRAVDGALGAELLGAFKALIENPVTMVV